MKIKKYDYLINDNGDIWMVERVHRDGAMTIGHSDGSEITYSAGEMEAWFRKIPSDEGEKWFDGSGWVDPAPYWGKVEEQTNGTDCRAREVVEGEVFSCGFTLSRGKVREPSASPASGHPLLRVLEG